MNLEHQTTALKQDALNLGFSACGIAKAEFLADEKIHYENYLQRGDFGENHYLARNVEKRLNPALVLENTKSVIVVLWDYSHYVSPEISEGKIAKYACGEDYHALIKSKLQVLENRIRQIFPESKMRSFVDASPVLEKAWAIRAGLGFRGKNTLLIHPEIGSFCNIGVILSDQEWKYDSPIEHTCGTCIRCLQNCPTGALESPFQLNAKKCISNYNTREKCETSIFQKHGWLKGCDACQNCCPFN